MTSDFQPRTQLRHLIAYGVDFVVVGGIAATIHGSSRDTFDLDICPSNERSNLDVLGTALLDMDAQLRGVKEDVPFVPDGRTLKGVELLTLDTKFGPLDILLRPDGCPPYAALRRRAKRVDVGSAAILIASIEDLLDMKRAAGRKKDEADVEELEAIKRLARRLKRSV